MTGVLEAQVGPVRLRVEGVARLPERTRRWVTRLYGAPAASGDAATTVTVRFEPRPVPVGPTLASHPLRPADAGVLISDHLARTVHLPLLAPERPVSADPDIEYHTFHEWVHLPLLRATVWRQGGVLLRAAGVVIDGEAVALSGPMGRGKTRTALELVRRGADLLGDDWIHLAPDGTAGATSQLLGLRGANHDLLPASATDPTRRLWAAVRTVAGWGARRTGRWPRASIGLHRIAHLATSMGIALTSLAEVLPDASLGGPAPLTSLIDLSLGGPGDPLAVGERLAAQAHLDVPAGRVIEQAVRYSHPGALREPWLPTVPEEAARIATGLTATRIHGLDATGRSADVDHLVHEILSREAPA